MSKAPAGGADWPPWLADIARDLPPLLTVEQVATLLRVHHRTVRVYIRDRSLRAVQAVPGRGSSRVLVPRSAVLEWLHTNEVIG